MKKSLIITTLLFTIALYSQNDINQNGVQTSVISNLMADATQAKRYEIATIGYNSYHWQAGGLIIVELFQTSYGTGYEKYIIENGFFQGSHSGSPLVKLVESHGIFHSAKISLGTPIDLTSTLGGEVNRKLPVYFDVRSYANYRVKITYLQVKVDTVTDSNEIKINQNPIGINIPDFGTTDGLDNDLKINGLGGNHYILGGNLGIGTIVPDEKLTVKGKIHTQEVRVDMAGALVPDYVFADDYKLKSLQEIESYIKENKHLPEIPSAKEIEKNGLMLAEMNMALLKKVEEMTLYIIEQNKRIEKLEKNQQK
ncbi:hypothetical protein ACWA1F_13140 [Flavobacterium sp. 3-218]